MVKNESGVAYYETLPNQNAVLACTTQEFNLTNVCRANVILLSRHTASIVTVHCVLERTVYRTESHAEESFSFVAHERERKGRHVDLAPGDLPSATLTLNLLTARSQLTTACGLRKT